MRTTKKLPEMQSRREVLKKGAYAAPAILTLAAVPAFAGKGSGRHRRHHGDSDSWGGWGDSDSDSDSD